MHDTNAAAPGETASDAPDTPSRSSAGSRGGWRWLADGGWVDRARALDAFARQRERDGIGVRLHTLFACAALFLLGWPTTWVEIGAAPLVVYFVIRANNTWRTWLHALGQPVPLLVFAWALWHGAALLWSGDPGEGLKQMSQLRWALLILLLWPVIEHRRVLVAALALGYIAGNLSQLSHAIGTWLDIDAMTWDRLPDRVSGWWDPAVAGSLLTGALGLHLPAAMAGRGRTRAIGIAGLLITAAGVVATGTRGAWIAIAVLVAIGLAWSLRRAWREGTLRPRTMGVGACVIVLVVAGVWAVMGGAVVRRVEEGRAELARMVEEGRYDTSTGARVLMLWWGVEAITERPLGGVGTGGYASWVRGNLERRGIDPADRIVLAHAHNAYLHVGATTGAVGLLIGAALVFCMIRAGVRNAGAGREGTYDLGPAWAIVGLLLVSAFDTVHVNQQTAAMLFALAALCPAQRPPARALGDGRRLADDRGPACA